MATVPDNLSFVHDTYITYGERQPPVTRFEYDAVANVGKRKLSGPLLRSEDSELPQLKRDLATTDNRKLVRNFAIAMWAVRCHLDYVTNFMYQAKTTDDKLNTRMEEVVGILSKKEYFDIARRHSRRRFNRISEARRVIDGDFGHLKIASGHLQGIEGDRLRNPTTMPDGMKLYDFVHGVQIDKAGAAVAYALHNRGLVKNIFGGSEGFTFDRMIPARNLYLHAHYSDRMDQTRGISPLECAINSYKDLYEGFDYALAKIKVSQLFGLAITKQSPDGVGVPYETETDEDGEDTGRYKVDFGTGPQILELDPGDTAQFLQCSSPASETQAFFAMIIAVALKALDIPYCFWDESHTNYTGSRGAFLRYDNSAIQKRDDNRDALCDWHDWRMQLAIMDGWFSEWPGITLADLKHDWLHRGLPWLDPFKEVQAESKSVDELTDNSEDIAQRHGKNFFENVDKQAKCIAYAAKLGVPFRLAAGLQMVAPPDEQQPGQKGKRDEQGKDSADD